MRRRMAARLLGQYPHWDYLDTLGVQMPGAFREIAASGNEARAGEAADFVPDALVRSTVLAGDAEHVARQLAGVLRPEVGSITIRPHCVEGESAEDVIRLFAGRGHAAGRVLGGHCGGALTAVSAVSSASLAGMHCPLGPKACRIPRLGSAARGGGTRHSPFGRAGVLAGDYFGIR